LATESILEQYRVHDFVTWHERKELTLNPYFQRRGVWEQQAQAMLIDTILRQMPIPKVYMRTRIDVRARKSIREVVDGQQRLRAIIDFANNEYSLTKRTREYAGKRYADLDELEQERFLSYPIAVDQLLNASDTDVLEVFARLNSYTVSLSPAEKRHAKYQGDFKWDVHQAALDWRSLWERFGIVAGRDRLRMGDDSLMAEMFGIILEGVTDGGATRLNLLYESYDDDFPDRDATRGRLDDTVEKVLAIAGELIENTDLKRSPQFLMLFAAVASGLYKDLPTGQVESADFGNPFIEADEQRARLSRLAGAIEQKEESPRFAPFVRASSGTTQRIATRRVRFQYYRWALFDDKLPVTEPRNNAS
jgi:hypothetical protein